MQLLPIDNKALSMDVRFLVTFMEVAHTRHFGKAAENLYLTQSAVSARIKQLEEYFNSTLFIRNRNSLKLTVAGEKLLPYAETLANTLNQARQALSDENIQQLTLACTPNGWDVFLKHQLHPLQNQFSDLRVKADVYNNEQLMRLVHEHAVDCAITTTPFKSDDVETLALRQSPLGLFESVVEPKSTPVTEYVYVDWGKKYNDTLDKRYPDLKQAKFRSASLQVAIQHASSHPVKLVLPINAQSLIKDIPLQLIEPIEDLTLNCYLIYLKQAKQTWLNQIVKFLSGNI